MKQYMTEEDLIEELVNNKKIKRETIPDGIFQERGYTTLVTPYKRLICLNQDSNSGNYLYKENGDFSEYLNLAKIDDYISNKFSIYIECFEKYFKTYVGELLATKMKNLSIYCNNYTEISSFLSQAPTQHTINNYRATNNRFPINWHINCFDLLYIDEMYDDNLNIVVAEKNLILNRRRAWDNLMSQVRNNGNSSNLLVKHHYVKNEIPPIWVLIHTLSLGDVMAIYNMFNRQDRIIFARKVLNKRNVRYRELNRLSAKINRIRIIRNNINHYEPLIPLLIKYFDDGEKDAIFSIVNMLKTLYKNNNLKSVKVILYKKSKKIVKNDFNKKRITFLNNLLRSL